MKKLFKEAEDLYKSINSLEKVIDECEKNHHWVSIYTPNHKDDLEFGFRFTKRLVEKLKELKVEYEKEFEELKE